jgi:DNA-binding MarR family transcriptional regulator
MSKTMKKTSIPAVGEGKRGEQGHIGYLLRQAHTAHRLRMERALSDLEVTLPQFSVLTMLVAYPGASGADLARLSLLTPQTMSVIVANLERSGAISRSPHAVHGRIQQIEVTEAGRQLLARCRDRARAIEDALLAGISQDDQQAVRRWLVKVAMHVDAD